MKYKLSDICTFTDERIAVTDLDLDNYISTENMLQNKEGVIRSAGLPTVNQIQAYQPGDVLISNIRPYFKKIWYADRSGGCSNDVLVLRPKENTYPGFLYYLLSDNAFFNYATATAKGTKMPRGDKDAIMKYEVPNLPICIQIKIADILSALDAQISNNKAINNHLEQIAQAVFKKEFVSLSSLPIGWQQASLIDIADYLNGLAMQKYRPTDDERGIPVLKIKELRQGGCDNNSELCSPNIKSEYIIQNGDVIFSWSGSLLIDFWCDGICGLNQHLFKVSSKKYDKWFYYAWIKHYLNHFIAVAADKATTMGHIKRDELIKTEVFIPTEEDYNRIGSLLNPIYDLIISNRIENNQLAKTRNSLLPRLISGELDISEI